MEVRGRQPGGADEAQERFRRAQAELSNANRARVRRARQVLQTLSAERLRRQRSANRQAAESVRTEGDNAIRGQGTAASEGKAAERAKSTAETEATQAQARAEKTRAQATTQVEKQDRLELSNAAREAAGKADEARDARLQELKATHQSGKLNTPERISQAAQRLLGG